MSLSDPTATVSTAQAGTSSSAKQVSTTTTTIISPKTDGPPTTIAVTPSPSTDDNNDNVTEMNDNDNGTPSNNNHAYNFEQWVDYLPHDVVGKENAVDDKRSSLDVTESHLTESQDDDWPDTASLQDDLVMVPNVLLIEHDVRVQHELLLDDPQFGGGWIPAGAAAAAAAATNSSSGASTCSGSTSTTNTTTTASLPTQRRLLWATMQASQQTRRYLEPHIRQRASLARVLQSIEHTSVSLQRHVCLPLQEENEHEDYDDVDVMDICDDENDQEMLASALSGLLADDDDDVAVDDDHDENNDNDETMKLLTTVAEEDLPEPPELTVEDIEATDFSKLVQNEPDGYDNLEFYDPMI